MEYRTNELSFNLPGVGWIDRSVQRLHVPVPDGGVLLFQIERDHAISHDVLTARVRDDIQDRRRDLRGFELLTHEDFGTEAGQGTAYSYRTVAPDGARFHHVAYIPLRDVLLIFSVTAWSPYEAECREVIREAVASIRFV